MRIKNILLIIILCCVSVFSSELDLKNLSDAYKKHALAPQDLRSMKHDILVTHLQDIANQNSKVKLTQIGSSIEGRSINMLSFGSGDTKLLLWSQMHGDEPTATASLLAIFNYLVKNSDHPFVENLYKNISINAIVMLNPDGAERFQRRNAQDIDINRDARLLQSPEARTLKVC